MDRWTTGYTQAELDAAQERYDLPFPPDLTALLREKQPTEGYDWRGDDPTIRRMLRWPSEALTFDIENGFWWPDWGERPADREARAEILRDALARAPRLIPIYSHRFLPATPTEAGNPVFSMHGFDTIYYGSDLADYCAREFGSERGAVLGETRHIDFWSDLAEGFDRAYAFYAKAEENQAALDSLRNSFVDKLPPPPPDPSAT